MVALTTLISLFRVGFSDVKSGYENFYLLPLSFGLVYIFCYSRLIFNKKTSPYLYAIIIIFFLRYVAYPFLVVVSGFYDNGGRNINPIPSPIYEKAIILMCYELFIYSIAIYYFERSFQKRRTMGLNLLLINSYYSNRIYHLFFFIGTLMLILNKSWTTIIFNPLQLISDDDLGSEYGTSNTMALALGNLFYVLKNVFFVAGTLFVTKLRYIKKTISAFTFWSGILVLVAFVTAFSFGLNRMKIVIMTIVSLYYVYLTLKPYIEFRLSHIAIGLSLLILPLITLNLVTNARNYYSTSDSWTASKAGAIQVYLGGAHNVATCIDMNETNPDEVSLKNLAFDFVRPTLGINYLVRNSDLKYSNQLFNKHIYGNDHMAQIIPIIGQGYIYFGFILSPLIGLLFIGLAYYLLNQLYNKNNSPYFTFFLLLVIFRLALLPGQNSMNFMNYISFNLIIIVLLELINNFDKQRRIQ